MTLYELLRQVSDILTPQTHSLYGYLLHTSDDNGFLRTRYCHWDAPVPDHAVSARDKVLICFRDRFTEGDPYYEEEPIRFRDHEEKLTLVKLQLFYNDTNFKDAIGWSRLFPYPEACIVDLREKTFAWESYSPLT